MGLVMKVLDLASLAVFGVMFMGAGLVTNMLQIASLVILPLDRDRYRRVNNCATSALFCVPVTLETRRLGSAFMKFGVFMIEDWGGLEVSIVGDQVPEGVNALCVVNHSSDVDWAVGLSYFSRRGRPFPGAAKAIAKDSLKYIPVYGWLVYFMDYMFVKRDWERDQISLARQAQKLTLSKDPYWVVLFPEGTRRTEKKLAHSQAYCKAKGLPVLDHVLFPRFKAFTLVVENMRGTLDGICDATVSFDSGAPKMSTCMMRKAKGMKARITIRYIPMSSIPEGEKELEEWLTKLWTEKDQTMATIEAGKDQFFAKQPRHTFPEEVVDYRHTFVMVALYFVLLIVTVVLVVLDKYVRRAFAALTVLFWVGTGVALAMTIPPSKVGAGSRQRKVAPDSESGAKKEL